MTPCDGTATSEKWCCGTTRNCCNSSPIIVPAKFGVDAESKSSSSTSIASSSIAASTTADSASSTSAAATPPSSSSGISGGAIAGIVIGALAGLVLVFAAGFLVAKKRRAAPQNPYESREMMGESVGYGHGRAEIYRASADKNSPIHEAEANEVREADSDHEVDKKRQKMQELP
jgi:hypothetical protein